jgi:hypothetical protein
MLRWTCRLRTAFEERGFLLSDADSVLLSKINEAEFVDPKQAFPHEFRWETFCSSFRYGPYYGDRAVTLEYPSADAVDRRGLVPAVNTRSPTSPYGMPINNLGKRDIDVLWLSPTVFISVVKFLIANQMIHDYEVTVGCTTCFITQLPAFDQVAFEKPSSLPIFFFQHLAPSAHCLTFARNRFHPKRLPESYMGSLFTVFPTGKRIVLNGPINSDELRVVLSLPFHQLDTLSFSDDPLDDSVSLDVLMELLKTAHDLHRIELPWQMFYDESEELEDVRLKIKVDSPALSMTYEFKASPTYNALNAISRIHQAGDSTRFHIHVDGLWEGENVALATSVVHPFLDGLVTLENLQIQFRDEETDGRPEPNVVHQVIQALASAMISCRSKHLCHFNVSFSMYDFDKFDKDDDDDDYDDYDDNYIEWNINKIRQWDATIFPQLALNWCSKKLTQAPDLRLLISAINQGILYRKTTDHIPFNMNIANASVIFDRIKTEAVKAEQG